MDTYDYSAIGSELKRLRTEHACTQEQMAEHLGCTPAYISNVENNRAKLSLRVLSYYAKLFHVPVDSILHAGQKEIEPQSASSILDSEALEILHQFPLDEQTEIIKVLRYLTEIRDPQ